MHACLNVKTKSMSAHAIMCTHMCMHTCVCENDNCQNTIMTTFATKIFLSLEVFLTTSSRKDIQHFKIYFFFCKGLGLVWMYTW